MYKISGITAICLAFAFSGLGQDNGDKPPAPPTMPEVSTPGSGIDSGGTQSEIIIRQKGDKDSKVTVEIRNGKFFINGQPLDKFDDANIEIEKREVDEDGPMLSIVTSPFRGNDWQDRFQRDNDRIFQRDNDRNNLLLDMQRNGNKAYKNKPNGAFLGVSSRKAETGGATVLEVTKGSPAEKAGLKKGDVINKVNEDKIESPDNLYETVHQFKPGEKIKITFKREGKEQTTSAVLDKSKMEPEAFNYNYRYSLPDLGNLSFGPDIASSWSMPPKIGIKAQDSEEGKGVNVLEVAEGSSAEKAGLKKGDVITSVDDNEVNSANELVDQIREARSKQSVKVKILRNGKQENLEIKIPRKLKTAEL